MFLVYTHFAEHFACLIYNGKLLSDNKVSVVWFYIWNSNPQAQARWGGEMRALDIEYFDNVHVRWYYTKRTVRIGLSTK